MTKTVVKMIAKIEGGDMNKHIKIYWFRHSRYLHVLRVIRTCYEIRHSSKLSPKNNNHIVREINININSRK